MTFTFKSFLFEAPYEMSRSVEISKDKFIKLLNTSCLKNANSILSSGTAIYRGIWKSPHSFIMMDSNRSNEKRTAANVRNQGNLILSNSEKWSDYPKRDESFICSSSSSYARQYAKSLPYLIIPFDDTKIGVCPDKDIFYSFSKIPYPEIASFYKYVGYDVGINFDAHDWNKFIEQNKKLDDLFKNGNEINKSSIKESLLEFFNIRDKKDEFFETCKKDGILKTLENEMDPRQNGFSLTTDISKIPSRREVWFSGKAIALNSEEAVSDPKAAIQELLTGITK